MIIQNLKISISTVFFIAISAISPTYVQAQEVDPAKKAAEAAKAAETARVMEAAKKQELKEASSEARDKEDKADAAASAAGMNKIIDNFSWENAGFGLGIGFLYSPKEIVDSAGIYGNGNGSNVVRIDKSSTGNTGFWLETHYLFGNAKKKNKGIGPFIAVQTGSPDNKLIGAAAIGVMAAFRYDDHATQSFNIGFGVAATTRQQLGDGFEEGKAPPNGETAIRYRTRTTYGPVIMSSFSF